MPDNLPPQLYGVWIPKQGWWKLPAPNGVKVVYGELRFEVAEHYARKIGKGAHAEPLDQQLILGNEDLLAIEKEREGSKLANRFVRWIKSLKTQ